MSSEDKMSDVVGEDVMPLAYMGMDEESSPSSSGRTGEGVSAEESVGEGDDILTNIMEVDNELGGCYDPKMGIVSEVREYKSELGSRGSLRNLSRNCNLPPHVLIRPAEVNEKACSTPRDHWMPMYVHYLATRLSERGWYYFGPQTSSKGNRSLFTPGPSSIKGWKEKFFFVDDTEWSRREAEVEYLSAWKVKKAKLNEYKLNEDEKEEVEKLVREEGDLVDILYLTSSEAINGAELYGPSSLSEAEMEKFFSSAGGVAIFKKPRKKSRTSTAAGKGVPKKQTTSRTSVPALEAPPRSDLKRKASEETSEEVQPLKRKKKDLLEDFAKGDEVVEFVPCPPPSSLFNPKNSTGAKRFLKATLPAVDQRQAREEVMSRGAGIVVKHALESASWVNALAHEFSESVKEGNSLPRQCEELQKEKEESERDTLSTRLVFEEQKRKICEYTIDAQEKEMKWMEESMTDFKKKVEVMVHNSMEQHIVGFLKSHAFEEIVNLYRLPTAVLAFTECRKKLKAKYPEVDVTLVTFGEQEEGVEEDGESLNADFKPEVELKWEHTKDGLIIFPPKFEVKFVAVEEEEAEVEGTEAAPHPVSSSEVPPAFEEVEGAPTSIADPPPPPTEEEPLPPPPPAKEQPPLPTE
ncbi:hypothetical protein SLEP1_g45571 [Rubroshorea leprosula]|uniref:Uncharacterized protein n=1 Tax=Rubroshorea leprosula TaxID=152421 RepID=A0AAV5LJF1_9ROSI|nr:hypothetical protein SLEP1_g45571 [Rubroshorea leprosula]